MGPNPIQPPLWLEAGWGMSRRIRLLEGSAASGSVALTWYSAIRPQWSGLPPAVQSWRRTL